MYTAKNDIHIGDRTFSSNLQVPGRYISNKKFIKSNKNTSISENTYFARTWDPENKVSVNTYFSNNDTFCPAEADGNNFDVTITVGKSPIFTYQWTSAEEAEKQLKDNLAYYQKDNLNNEIRNESGLYLSKDTEKFDQIKSDINVTVDTSDQDGILTHIYHVRCSNPNVKFREEDWLSWLNVSASGFTLPSGIETYDQDVKRQQPGKHYNFNGSALTDNEALRDAVNNTLGIGYKIEAIKPDGSKVQTNVGINSTDGSARYDWHAAIFRQTLPLSVENSASASELRKVFLSFRDIASPNADLPNGTFTAQGGEGNKIEFSGANNYLNYLKQSDNYLLDHVVSSNHNNETQLAFPSGNDKYNLDKFAWGKFENTNASRFIVYLKKNSASFNIHYIDVGRTNKTSGFTSKDENVIDNGSHDIKVNSPLNSSYDVTGSLWKPEDYEKEGFELIQEPEKIGKGIMTDTMPDQYIYLRHKITNISKSKTIHEKIKYLYENGTEAFPTYQKDITFNLSGKYDGHDKQNFGISWNPSTDQTFAKVLIPTKAGYNFTSKNDNLPADKNIEYKEGKNVYIKEFDKINPDSEDINLTVIYTKAKKPVRKSSYNIHYIDIGEKTFPTNKVQWQPSDGNEILEHKISNINGNVDEFSNVTNMLWNYSENYVLVSAPADLAKAKFTQNMPDQYVYLRRKENNDVQPEKISKQITEIVNYIFEDENGNEIRHQSFSSSVSFSGFRPAGSTKNYTWTPDSFIFKSIPIDSPNNYDLISVARNDKEKTNELGLSKDGEKQINAVKVIPNDSDVIITVIFKKQSSPSQSNEIMPDSKSQPTTPSQDTDPIVPTQPSEPEQPTQPQMQSKLSDKTVIRDMSTENHSSSAKKKSNKLYKTTGVNNQKVESLTYRPLRSSISVAQTFHSSNGVREELSKEKLINTTNQLPETGEKQNKFTLVGLALVSIAGLIGMAVDRKRNN
ncbi:hypothetical protein FC39_GL000420 [Lactobacillus hamsteri DSM 5661 = JCM 6256]|uniref:Gram-positive cocci surface proteins LPxTG domain-containing protein n=2 Tax=Lactobacillus hamsteri TaxID=96565 RepID=A0A0R1YN39_9LACO|nr:hypothetical protein FC39_GL000420 [Lactobacillus hamsteri DSM 5661 = JCM 6256]